MLTLKKLKKKKKRFSETSNLFNHLQNLGGVGESRLLLVERFP